MEMVDVEITEKNLIDKLTLELNKLGFLNFKIDNIIGNKVYGTVKYNDESNSGLMFILSDEGMERLTKQKCKYCGKPSDEKFCNIKCELQSVGYLVLEEDNDN